MMNDPCHSTNMTTSSCSKKRVCWSAILVGALVAIGLCFLLNLFSIAIGLSLVTQNKEGMMTLAVGGFIALTIATIAPFFTAGYAAGYLGRPYCEKRNLGCLYGFTAWSLALILTALLAATMGRYVSFYSNFVTSPNAVAISVNLDKPAMMPAVSTVKMQNNDRAKAAVSATTEKAANTLGFTSFLIFILFFISAFSASLGGYFGMCCCHKDENCGTTNR